MKTKKFLMLLVAVLLSCVSAMAQSGNNESLKGDVNGDGTVDVADLTAIIKIMKDAGGAVGEKMCYWYAGTKQVEASNFTDIASRIPESEIPQTGSVSATGQFVYFVLPETKRLASLVGANGSPIKYDYTDAFGYRIYKTLNTINETVYYTVEQITYYWYAGQTDPSTMDSINPIVDDMSSPGWRLIGTTLPTYSSSNKLFEYVEGGEIVTGTSLAKQYIAIPAESSACPRDGAGNDASKVDMYTKLSNVTISGVTYKVYETVGKSKKLAIDIY